MSRYIDANKLRCERTDFDTYKDYCLMFDEIDNAQTVDVRENTHGKWIKNEGGFDPRDNFYHCSECGRVINVICGDDLWNYPFCHCGANMRE